jgi:thiol-disulfide isomerase/thioredoxin
VVGSNFITKNNSSVSNIKKILLDEFTGPRCPNCPDAIPTLTTLISQYSNSIVVIAIHAGNFAKPIGNFANQDFRTDAGDAWNGAQGFNTPSYPSGLINRKNYSGNGLSLNYSSWPSVANIAKSDPLVVKLDVTTNYDTTLKALNTSIRATFKTSYSNNVKVLVALTEDGIKGLQDVRGVEMEDYDFEHVLRGSVNGDWGSDLKTTPIAANDSVKVSYENFSLNDLKYTVLNKPIVVNDKNISVIVFAYDALTREILQVEKVKIR